MTGDAKDNMHVHTDTHTDCEKRVTLLQRDSRGNYIYLYKQTTTTTK